MSAPTEFEQPIIPEDSQGKYQFCPAVSLRPVGRCVAGINHERMGSAERNPSGHDFQPLSSVTVRAIERQEFPLERLGYDRPYYASQRAAEDVVDAAAAAAPGTETQSTDMGEVSA